MQQNSATDKSIFVLKMWKTPVGSNLIVWDIMLPGRYIFPVKFTFENEHLTLYERLGEYCKWKCNSKFYIHTVRGIHLMNSTPAIFHCSNNSVKEQEVYLNAFESAL